MKISRFNRVLADNTVQCKTFCLTFFERTLQKPFHAPVRVVSLRETFDFDIYEVASFIEYQRATSLSLIKEEILWKENLHPDHFSDCLPGIRRQFVTDIGKGCKINCAGPREVKRNWETTYFPSKKRWVERKDKVCSRENDVTWQEGRSIWKANFISYTLKSLREWEDQSGKQFSFLFELYASYIEFLY